MSFDLSTLKPKAGPVLLSEHPAVVKLGFGVSSEELADFTNRFAKYAETRILGTGKESYENDGKQEFEDFTVDRIVDELIDELADAQNYIAMLAIRVLALRNMETGQ